MRSIFIAGVIAGTIASAASAQMHGVPNPERAAALISQAQGLDVEHDRKRIAGLYEQASGFFSPGDPQASQSLNYAAQFYYTAGNKSRAIDLLERGALMAAIRGAPVEAADLYVAAAVTATETRDYLKRRRFVDNVLQLVATQQMTEADRVRLLRRVVSSAADR
jgi:hypothetical protein